MPEIYNINADGQAEPLTPADALDAAQREIDALRQTNEQFGAMLRQHQGMVQKVHAENERLRAAVEELRFCEDCGESCDLLPANKAWPPRYCHACRHKLVDQIQAGRAANAEIQRESAALREQLAVVTRDRDLWQKSEGECDALYSKLMDERDGLRERLEQARAVNAALIEDFTAMAGAALLARLRAAEAVAEAAANWSDWDDKETGDSVESFYEWSDAATPFYEAFKEAVRAYREGMKEAGK